MAEGMKCPDCGRGKIELRWHLVDIGSYDGAGMCSCEWWAFSVKKKLDNMTKERRLIKPIRCGHIDVARTFCLDMLLRLHIWEQNGGKKVDEGI
jgi:ssDNA-binding Zn-finger/Zn-ribbon topoisomerase 1